MIGFSPLLPSNFLWGHPQISLLCLHLLQPHSPSYHSVDPSLNSISVPPQPQFSPTRLSSSYSPLSSPGGTSQLLGTPLQVLRVHFQQHLELCHKWRSQPEYWYLCGNILLLDSNASGVCKRPAIEENINKKDNKKGILLLILNCALDSSAQHTHLSQRLVPSILILISLWYLASYFSLTFLKDWQFLLSFERTFLHLDSIIWDFLALSKRVVGDTLTVSSSSSLLQASAFQLPPLPQPLSLSLLSEPYAPYDGPSLLLPNKLGTVASSYAVAAFYSTSL